jgi:hypothetical protein
MEQEFDPSTLEDTLAKGAGSMLGKFIIGKVGAKGFELVKKNPKLVNNILRGSNILKGMQDNAPGMFKEYISNKANEGSGLFQYLDNIFEFNKQDASLKHYDPKNIFNAAPFTNKVAGKIATAAFLEEVSIANIFILKSFLCLILYNHHYHLFY